MEAEMLDLILFPWAHCFSDLRRAFGLYSALIGALNLFSELSSLAGLVVKLMSDLMSRLWDSVLLVVVYQQPRSWTVSRLSLAPTAEQTVWRLSPKSTLGEELERLRAKEKVTCLEQVFSEECQPPGQDLGLMLTGPRVFEAERPQMSDSSEVC
jgi:hypothetical protein